MKIHPLLFAALLTLVACSSSDNGAPPGQTAAEMDAKRAADEARAAVEALAGQVGSPACTLDDDAKRVGEVLAWFESSGEETTVAGRDREAWSAHREALASASTTASAPETFAAFWTERGGSTDPHGYLELGARLAHGDEAAIGELDPGQPTGYASMLTSALDKARARDDRAAMTRLVEALLAANIGRRDRVAAAAYLLHLGRDAEAQAILDAHAGTAEPVALGGVEGSMFLVRFIEAKGVAAAFERMRNLFGDSALDFAIAAAPGEYENRADDDGLAAFLASPILLERLGSSENAFFLSRTTAKVIAARGEDVGLDLLGKQTEVIRASDPEPARGLALLTRDLAGAGCSDACLRVPVAAIDMMMGEASSPASLREHHTQALAASGALDQALEAGTEAGELLLFAISHAVGRRDPAYIDPLLPQLEGSARIEASSRLAAELHWRDAPRDAVGLALSRRPADSPPDMWLNMLAGSTVHNDRREPQHRAMREVLVGWSLGLCAVAP